MRTIINNQSKKSLSYIQAEDKCSNLIIVTMNEERVIEKNGYKIKVVPVHKF